MATSSQFLDLEAWWNELAEKTGIPKKASELLFAQVIHMYNEPMRHYHTSEHIWYLLKAQREYFPEASLEVQWAIWFHDIVYIPSAPYNEDSSANTADAMLHPFYDDMDKLDEIQTFICETKNHYDVGYWKNWPGVEIVCDLDLMGLGGPPEAYDANTAKIRKEFCLFSDEQWLAGRKNFLEDRLRKARKQPVFKTEIMHSLFEDKALANMERELESYG